MLGAFERLALISLEWCTTTQIPWGLLEHAQEVLRILFKAHLAIAGWPQLDLSGS